MPYNPPSWNDTRIAAAIQSTGSAVELMPTARPEMMFVAAPVRESRAICCAGPRSFDV